MNQNLQTVLTAAGTAIAGVLLTTALGVGPKAPTTVVRVPAKQVTLAPKANGILKSDGTTVEEAFKEVNEDVSVIKRDVAEVKQVLGDMLRDGSKAVRKGILEEVDREAKEQLTRSRSESKLAVEDAKRRLKEAEKKAADDAKAAKSDAKANPLARLISGLSS